LIKVNVTRNELLNEISHKATFIWNVIKEVLSMVRFKFVQCIDAWVRNGVVGELEKKVYSRFSVHVIYLYQITLSLSFEEWHGKAVAKRCAVVGHGQWHLLPSENDMARELQRGAQ
jgi:hypothetical protein